MFDRFCDYFESLPAWAPCACLVVCMLAALVPVFMALAVAGAR